MSVNVETAKTFKMFNPKVSHLQRSIADTSNYLKSVFYKKILAKPFGTQNFHFLPYIDFIDFNGAKNVNFLCAKWFCKYFLIKTHFSLVCFGIKLFPDNNIVDFAYIIRFWGRKCEVFVPNGFASILLQKQTLV